MIGERLGRRLEGLSPEAASAIAYDIPLDQLRYWSVELQEPYSSAEIAFERSVERRGKSAS